ncbi:indeterminate(ID)-domain 14 [Hibiscus trionum]|uniref:Indeterminate(ID)-domain 14 n=1 Tax=Hibiscus trionum TaxID=183268 RepID=A0A9W7IXS9_HIBTR|nr:indeterminate(ID)-domain 14 [Hibiscus trionum]
MLDNNSSISVPSSSSDKPLENGVTHKRKRKPAGTPDPDAEVVSLSPKTLLESDRYVCEICNQGFQRDQNLQMHRRRHKVPWKLLKRESQEVKKRVFVCPEPTCLHHDPCHALGDLVGIKKHYRRKHSNQKQWVCEKCSKGYAVQSDYKAHLKTCGSRGHSCDCGRVFSRVESFIEHQDACTFRRVQTELQALQPVSSSRTASSTSPSSDANFGIGPSRGWLMPKSTSAHQQQHQQQHNLELQLLPTRDSDENYTTHLKLGEKYASSETTLEATRLKELASGQLKLAMAEMAYAEKARQEAKMQIEMSELDFASAKRIRQQAQRELEKAQALKDQATKKISSTIMQITCQACKHLFQTSTAAVPDDETSLAMSYISSATTEGEGE